MSECEHLFLAVVAVACQFGIAFCCAWLAGKLKDPHHDQ